MKKLFMVMFILMFGTFLFACQGNGSTQTPSDQLNAYPMIFSYMGTEIQVVIYLEDESEGPTHRAYIDQIYKTYHEISEYKTPPSINSEFKENIFSINQKPNLDLEIDQQLYDMLLEAEAYKILTNGYFDISVGRAVAAWKLLTENYSLGVIPDEEFQNTLNQIEAIEIIEDPISLWEEDDKYYVKIKEGVMLDPGAITKGYATERVRAYLEEQNIEYYSISGGSSSISLGRNYNRETRNFHIALQNPVRTTISDRTYGMIYVQNTGVTTSGNYVQYAEYNDLRYHHIVSPFTNMPMHYYHTVTVVGLDLGLMDAISTALFNMPPDVFDAWVETHQVSLNIEIIRFNYDRTITTFLTNTVFEEH